MTDAVAKKPNSIAMAGIYPNSIAYGVLGSYLVLVDNFEGFLHDENHIRNVVAVQVDGKTIFPNVYYKLYKNYVVPAFDDDVDKYPTVEIPKPKISKIKIEGIYETNAHG